MYYYNCILSLLSDKENPLTSDSEQFFPFIYIYLGEFNMLTGDWKDQTKDIQTCFKMND